MATSADTAKGAAATTQLTLASLQPGRRGKITVKAHVGKQGERILGC